MKEEKMELVLEGLCCSNCAMKIEKRVNDLPDVENANVNFATKVLFIEFGKAEKLTDAEGGKEIKEENEPDNKKEHEEDNRQENGQENRPENRLENSTENRPENGQHNSRENGFQNGQESGSKEQINLLAERKERVLAEVKKIVKEIEPDVMVKEKKKKQMKVNRQEHSHAHLNHDFKDDKNHSQSQTLDHEHGSIKPGDACSSDSCGCGCCEDEEEEDNSSFKRKVIKFSISAVIFAVAMILKLPGWAELLLFLASYVLSGGDVLLKAARNIARGDIFDENFLMGIATIGAFAIGEFPEGVGVMLFYQIGEMFQDMAVNRSRKSIADLMDIRPDYVNLKIGDETKVVSPEEVTAGDIIIVKPGEKVPLDGKVIEGTSMVDTSALTGESVPREVMTGDGLLGGFINKNGLLTVEVTREFGESTVSKILDLVQNASNKKSPTENFITKFARRYTPVVTIAALIIAVIPPLILPDHNFSDWIYRALIFLVISCPCALVVSIPLGFFGGIGGASKHGVLVKGSNYLEALNYVETVVFDKTGTLTKGIFKVSEINPGKDLSKEELLKTAAYAESYSNHPIALSILKAYGEQPDNSVVEEYEEISGYGTRIKYNGKVILTGNAKLMEKEQIPYDKIEAPGTMVHLAVDGVYAGNIVISDEIKEDSEKAVKGLKALGIKKLVMLTGDSKAVGEKIGKGLGLDEVHAELLPDQKVAELEQLDSVKSAKGKMIFVGDGINDAPVLARADIGVAMGGLGSDAAIEAADVVLMTDEPSKLITAIKIAKKTHVIVWQNIIFALTVKLIFLLLGAGGMATMWEAVFADVGVALIAVLNAMRAMKVSSNEIS